MGCRKNVLAQPRRRAREVIAELFASGNVRAARRHRLNQCLFATDCGRLCEKLVKGPGKVAYCVDVQTGAKVDLYPALEDEEFTCPEGRF